MNYWVLLRRLRGPAFVILVGITCLLNQWNVLSFGRSWPLYLILAGVLGLAERAAMAVDPPPVSPFPPPYAGGYPAPGYPPSGYAPYPGPPTQGGNPPAPPVVSGSPLDDPFADPNRRS